jgi:hypothetical protein
MTVFVCRGCGETVSNDSSEGLASDLTEHDGRCEHHSRTKRCSHDGDCYEPSTNPEVGDER